MESNTKRCFRCKAEKSVAEFHKNKRTKDGLSCQCKPCAISARRQYRIDNLEEVLAKERAQSVRYRAENREKVLAGLKVQAKKNPLARLRLQMKAKYGITETEYTEFYSKQDGRCGICKTNLVSQFDPTRDFFRNSKDLARVDHCHETGKVRGLLCGQCNTGLGLLGDNVSTIQRAIRYLHVSETGSAPDDPQP